MIVANVDAQNGLHGKLVSLTKSKRSRKSIQSDEMDTTSSSALLSTYPEVDRFVIKINGPRLKVTLVAPCYLCISCTECQLE